jgi:hypothetical protein
MCRRSTRSLGQQSRSAYDYRLQKATRAETVGIRAKKHKVNERSTQKKGRYRNESSIIVEFSEKSVLSSSSLSVKLSVNHP